MVGVDTHTGTHAAALVDHFGAVHAEVQVAADPAGYAQLTAWATGQVPAGQPLRWSVEGTRCHGQGLTRHLLAAGHTVIEAPKPINHRRRRGKSDPIDAVHAAQAALAIDRDPTARHAEPRADGLREVLRILLVTRRHDTDVRTATINLFKSLLLGATGLRETLRGLSTTRQIRTVADLPDDPTTDLETQIRTQALRRAATTIRNLDQAITTNKQQLRTLVEQACPGLLDLPGVGPISAATLLTAWSHHNRVHSEAAFAALGGISPLPASSGKTVRHRLNRGGDRALNAALHTIVTARRRMGHTPTSDYITRRTTQGRTPKEILRCLKRYTIRSLYRYLQTNATTT
ncbi:IS110 family transposase [Dactylosporangium sp. AC04546]|uniref:IS110 family transposase n=1 Tax=Dactylosporangium sp. AC04546 TaxID=2862460 RepID=UPI002102EEC7|nr:IS110 family transposase [Dactylosporangium sp. AC04546]WVK85802.1 IS110 family transposase [Dactylosporangium sp. AC04546]